jgi:2-polyprenyl-3-methyl-5-hydroxy-6-metoxy-1,4-benzoquinol methylase
MWDHDSTIKLLGWKEVNVQLRICSYCFHFIIFPKFDTKLLYGNKGSKIRKEIYESYYPEKIYGFKSNTLQFDRDFSRLSQDFIRFYQTSLFTSQYAQSIFSDEKEIRILDWGGGDGYISSIYATLLSQITGLKVISYVYDYTDWGNLEINKVGLNDLKNMNMFHIIIFSHILEHSHTPILDLKSASSFLLDEGIVICEVPDERLYMAIRLIKNIKFGLNYHVHNFSRRSLHQLLEFSGFQSIATQYQYNSSYRGSKMSSILGVAQKKKNKLTKSAPSILYELASLLLIINLEILIKIVSFFKKIFNITKEALNNSHKS